MIRWALRRSIDTVIGTIALAVQAAGQGPVQPDVVNVYALSPGRIGAIVAGVVGQTGVVIGRLALAGSRRTA